MPGPVPGPRGWQASLPAVATAATALPAGLLQAAEPHNTALIAAISAAAMPAPMLLHVQALPVMPAPTMPAQAAMPPVADAVTAAIRPLPARISWLRAGAAQSSYAGAAAAGEPAVPPAGLLLQPLLPALPLPQPAALQPIGQPAATAPPSGRSEAADAAEFAAQQAGSADAPFPASGPISGPASGPAFPVAGAALPDRPAAAAVLPAELALAASGTELAPPQSSPPQLPLQPTASAPSASAAALPGGAAAVPALPDPLLAIASERLGAVQVDVSGSLDRLEVNLSASAAAAPILAGEVARLAQDLAAAGIALASYAVNGQRADVAAQPVATAAAAGFGSATGGNSGQHSAGTGGNGGQHAAAGSPVSAVFAGNTPPGVSARRSLSPSDRFA